MLQNKAHTKRCSAALVTFTHTLKEKQMATKASLVREMIVAAKLEGKTAADIVEAVVALGFTKPLAKAYINGNWEKALTPAEKEALATVVAAVEEVPIAA